MKKTILLITLLLSGWLHAATSIAIPTNLAADPSVKLDGTSVMEGNFDVGTYDIINAGNISTSGTVDGIDIAALSSDVTTVSGTASEALVNGYLNDIDLSTVSGTASTSLVNGYLNDIEIASLIVASDTHGGGGPSSLIGLSDTPVGYGTAGQVLTSDGVSTTTWETPSVGGGAFVTTTYVSGARVDGCNIQNTGTVSKLTANCDPWVTILGRPGVGQVDFSHQAYLSKGVCTVTIKAGLGTDESCYIRAATQTTTYLMVFCQNGGGTGIDRNFSIICTGETAL